MLRLLLIIVSNALAADKSHLLDIRSYSDKEAFVVELKFDKAAPTQGLGTEYINETIQVNIPSGFLAQGTRTAKINNGQVSTLYTYQADKDTLRSRIILRKGLAAEKFKGQVAVIPDGNYLKIRVVDNEPKTAAQILDAAPVLPQALRSEIAKEFTPVSENNLAASAAASLPTVNSQNTPALGAPTSAFASESTAVAQTEEAKIPVLNKGKLKSMKSESSLKSLFIAVAAVAAFALLMFFVSRQWIKVGRKNIKANQIKVITQHYLAPRKSLAIIRVAGESILIGITDNAITPIKTLSLLEDELPEELPSSFQSSMRQVEEAEPKFSLPEGKQDKVSFNSSRGVKAYANQPVKKAVAEADEEYSVRGIRELVKEKLKDMRTI